MRLISLIAAAAFAAVPAGAFDLTGTWEGSFNCSRFDGEKDKFTQNGVLLITQTGTALNVEWVGLSDLEGIAIYDTKKPDEKGQAALIDCTTTNDLTAAGSYAEITSLKVKANRAKGKGSLKGTSVYSEDGISAGQCKWNFKLTNTADPLVAATCP